MKHEKRRRADAADQQKRPQRNDGTVDVIDRPGSKNGAVHLIPYRSVISI